MDKDEEEWYGYGTREYFWQLDRSIVSYIVKYLPIRMVPTIALVCKAWRRVVRDESVLEDMKKVHNISRLRSLEEIATHAFETHLLHGKREVYVSPSDRT